MKKKLSAVLILLFSFLLSAVAQTTVVGTVVDNGTGEPIPGANVVEVGTTTGTISDLDGNFNFKVSSACQIEISFIGYKTASVAVAKEGVKNNVGVIRLDSDSKALEDVVVVQSIAVQRKTPVALSSLDASVIEEKIGTQEFPEVLKSTPGVYATKQGGGYGDSRINMRGFSSANVAVMVNGVPMNDMEWGGVYWSNWTGLTDVNRSIQTQRGLGASKISSPSVGGSINIVTKSIESKAGGHVSYSVGNDGYQKMLFTISSGMNEKGWAFTVLAAKTWGNGYVQGTEFEGYNWFVNIAKRINDNHQLSLTAFGAPQWHNQRSNYDGLTIVQWQQVKNYMDGESAYKYNPTYGFGKNGERLTSARNVYHKPQISLNHQWQISDDANLSTALYSSIGRGYGYSGQGTSSSYSNMWYGASNGSLNTTFRNADGTFAYDQIQEMNEKSDHGSDMVMSLSKNYHTWLGLISNYTNNVSDQLNISGGVDFRWYKGVHTNEISDLYNGEYFTDLRYRANVKASNNAKAADPNFKYEKLGVGDVVYRDYDGYTVQGGLYAQAEYTLNDMNFFLSGSVSNTYYWRYDRFYYDDSHAESDKLNFWGYTVKGGGNYNINEHNNVFFNAGYISRAPFFSGGAFLSSTVSNATNPNAVNEKIASFEVGYGFQSKSFTAHLNAYYTNWIDKTMTRSVDYTNAQGEFDRYSLNMEGVNARHMGVEIDFVAHPAQWVDFTGMLSLGNWVWDCNPTGYFYNSAGQPVADSKGTIASGLKSSDHAKMELMLDKVKVGGSAQTTAALGAKFKPMKGLNIGVDYNLYAKNYADWSFSSNDLTMNGVKVYESPWRMPSSCTFDANASYTFNVCDKIRARVSGNVNNLFDQEYIVDAMDGSNHDWKTAYRVFYGFGRTFSLALKLSF
ncbi:MAG: TonB-dependent receptor [Marinilabiliaceae bacterium]|nr:TonB-dependent receptor [Marinilabiliaceae bacterium]